MPFTYHLKGFLVFFVFFFRRVKANTGINNHRTQVKTPTKLYWRVIVDQKMKRKAIESSCNAI